MKDQQQNRHLKHATVFGIGAMLIPISGVFLLPLYVNYLSPTEFGTLEIVNRIANILCVCCLSTGIYHAVGSFYMQAANEKERAAIASTLLVFYMTASLLGFALLLPLIALFGPYFGVDDFSLLVFALGGNWILSTLEIPYVLMRCRMESIGFVVVTFLQFLIRILGTIIAVAWLNWGVWGVIAMYWISGVLFFPILFYREFRLGTFRPNPALFGPIAVFTLPFLPGGLCTFVQMNADRFFLVRYFDLGEVGLYAMAAKLAGCVAMLSALPLQRVWLVRQYQALPEPDGPEEAARWFTLTTATQLGVGLTLSLFCRELLSLAGREEYVSCASIVPVLVLAEYFLYANTSLEGPMFVYRRTLWKFYIGFAATLLLLGLFFLVVPRFGAIGTAWAVAAGYGFTALVSWRMSQRLRRIPYDGKTLCLFFFSAVLLYVSAETASAGIGSMVIRILVKTCFLLVYVGLFLLFRPWRIMPKSV